MISSPGAKIYEPVDFSSTSSSPRLQAALTFTCDDGQAGQAKGLVTRDDKVLELATGASDPVVKKHIIEVGVQSAGASIAAFYDVTEAFASAVGEFSTNDFLDPTEELLSAAAASGPRRHRKLAVARWTNCYQNDNQKQELTMGIAIGSTLFRNIYKSDRQTAINQVADVITKTNLVYGTQLNMVLKVGKMVIAGVDETPSWDNYATCNPHRMSINDQLNKFTSWAPKSDTQGAL